MPRRDVPLSEWTTLRVGGPAERLVEVGEVEALAHLLDHADDEGRPVLVLGQGSNVLISDEGFAGIVVRIEIKGRRVRREGEAVLISVGAGEEWGPFVESCVAESLSGIECLSGIPGLVGATPVQNVGAYGQEVKQTVERVTVWDRQARELRNISAVGCNFSYRASIFKRNDRYVVTNVLFRLRRSTQSEPLRYSELAHKLGRSVGERAGLAETAKAVLELRRSKGMVLDPADPDSRSVGSFFTNPVLLPPELARLRQIAPAVPSYPADSAEGAEKVPAAWLVEGAGFPKGYRRGGAAISSKHALALVALDGGRAEDVLALAREVREGVEERFGVALKPEPVLVGLHL